MRTISKTILLLIIVNMFVLPMQAQNNPLTTNSGSTSIVIDGSFADWADKPFVWEYNWNNPPLAGENGYTTNSRHKISLFRDDNNVYLHIIMAKNYYNSLVGNDYEFTCDGITTHFNITTISGASINNSSFGVGIFPVNLVNESGKFSGQTAQDCSGMLKRKSGGINDEVEIKIPIKDFHLQDNKIAVNNVKTISFFTPNLMMWGDSITCVDTDTAPYLGVFICLASVAIVFVVIRIKKRKRS